MKLRRNGPMLVSGLCMLIAEVGSMGKRRQEQRKRALTQTAVPAPTLSVPHIPSSLRDALMGTPLSPDTAHMTYRDYDPHRPEGTRYPVPTRLHRTRMAQQDRGAYGLGEPEYSPETMRYLATVKTIEQTNWRYWWRVPYVQGWLRAYWTEEAIAAVIVMLDGGDYREATDHTPFWVQKHVIAMRRYVRTHLLPYEN